MTPHSVEQRNTVGRSSIPYYTARDLLALFCNSYLYTVTIVLLLLITLGAPRDLVTPSMGPVKDITRCQIKNDVV